MRSVLSKLMCVFYILFNIIKICRLRAKVFVIYMCVFVHVYVCLHVQCCVIDFAESRLYIYMYI